MKNRVVAARGASLSVLKKWVLRGIPISVICFATAMSSAAPQDPQQSRQPLPRYTDASGAVQIVGNDGMESLLEAANTLFAKSHPEVHFKMYLHGSSTAMPALTAGTSAFAPMGRDIWPNDRANFKNALGYEPIDIKIGYAGWGPREGFKTPPAVYVNRSNQLAGLTMSQLRQILVTGTHDGDIRTWSQLPEAPQQVSRQIHVYGTSDDGGFATAFRLAHLQGLPFTSRYETLPNAREVMRAIATDPNGLGFVGWFDAAKTPGVRLLPIARAAGQPFASPSKEDLSADRYPLTSYLHIFINKPPGEAVAPWLADYLELLLSPSGQAIVGNDQSGEGGYLPLSESMRKAELEKVGILRRP